MTVSVLEEKESVEVEVESEERPEKICRYCNHVRPTHNRTYVYPDNVFIMMEGREVALMWCLKKDRLVRENMTCKDWIKRKFKLWEY